MFDYSLAPPKSEVCKAARIDRSRVSTERVRKRDWRVSRWGEGGEKVTG